MHTQYLNNVEMARFVQGRVYRISESCIRLSELWNDNQTITIVNFRMDSDFNIFVAKNSCFLYLLPWKTL